MRQPERVTEVIRIIKEKNAILSEVVVVDRNRNLRMFPVPTLLLKRNVLALLLHEGENND